MILSEIHELPLLLRVRELYKSSFPEDELKPFGMIIGRLASGCVELLAALEDGELAGLAITVTNGDIVLLDYLAVCPEKRGNGCGAKILSLLAERYPDKPIVIEIESTLVNAPDHANRTRRKRFYLKNEMRELDISVDLFGVEMELMAMGDDALSVDFERYTRLLSEIWGEKFLENVNLITDERSRKA